MFKLSEPWDRAVAIIRDKPRPASHADIVSITTGYISGAIKANFMAHRLRPIKIDSIIPSRQSRADNKCARWKDRPKRLSINVEESSQDSFVIIKVLWG